MEMKWRLKGGHKHLSEIETVGSNVQLFDKDNVNKLNGVPDVSSITSNTVAKSFYVQAKPNTTYTVSRKIIGSRFVVGTTANLPAVGETIIDRKVNNEGSSITLTTSKNVNYLVVYYLYNSGENEEEILDNIKIEKDSTATPWSAYGTGCTEIKVQNSEEEQTIVMPVQQEMLQGDYIEDVEHHEWGKIIITGEENWVADAVGRFSIGKEIYISRPKTPPTNDDYVGNLCNCYAEKTPTLTWNKKQGFCVTRSGDYLAIYDNTYSPNSDVNGFKAWLKSKYDANDPVVIYYKLANAIDLELTEAQKAVREQKLHTYKNITNINLSDELASIDVTYKKDLDTILNNLQAQIIANASKEVTE